MNPERAARDPCEILTKGRTSARVGPRVSIQCGIIMFEGEEFQGNKYGWNLHLGRRDSRLLLDRHRSDVASSIVESASLEYFFSFFLFPSLFFFFLFLFLVPVLFIMLFVQHVA